MNPFEVVFHVDLTHFIEKKQSFGTAKKILTFMPYPGLVVGPREILTIERVHWKGHNLLDAHLQRLAQIPRASAEDVYYPTLADMKAMVEDQASMLKWEWRDEATG